MINTTDLRQLAANTPVSDRRRYALREAAHEIDQLRDKLENAIKEIEKRGGKREKLILIDAEVKHGND